MKIEIDDAFLDGYTVFAVLALKPPFFVTVHFVSRPGDPRSIPVHLAEDVFMGMLKPEVAAVFTKLFGSGKPS